MKFTRPNLGTTRLAAVVFCTIVVLLAANAKGATPISGCTTINKPGKYVVTASFTCAVDAIAITANGVTLHLAGYTVTANVNAIHAISVKNLAIVGPGTVTTADQGCGVQLEGVTYSQVIGVTATQNAVGICLREDAAGTISAHNRIVANKANVNTGGITADASLSNVYLGNECSNNGGGIFIASGQGDLIEGNQCNINTTGIELTGTSEMVVGNETDRNVNVGIYVHNAGGNHMRNNEATSNGVDLFDGNPCMTNTWVLDAFFTSNSPCIG
jgi:parallel beta-helix repeat protein